ncbi:MAG: hypothetical protein SFZ02_12340 [bacterium]|nr:hypothetical protein [bacterium]
MARANNGCCLENILNTPINVDYLCFVNGDGSIHHFYVGGDVIVPERFTALRYSDKKTQSIAWDELEGNGIYRIVRLEWHNAVNQQVVISPLDALGEKEYTRHLPMCRTWSIPAELCNPYGLWQWASPFRICVDGVEHIDHSCHRITKRAQELIANGAESVQIWNGYGASIMYKETK